MVEVVKFDGEHANATLAKQLFMHDKKKKENMWLVCAAVDTQIDLKGLNKYLKVASGNLRAADLESMEKYLGCRKGMVNYFSIVNDTEKKVKVVLDKTLYESQWASFHPMDNCASTCISPAGIDKIKQICGRDESNFEILDFSTIGQPAAAEEKSKP
jgi:prolyl-tRNA synthetase